MYNTSMVKLSDHLKTLLEKKQKLLEEQEILIDLIKTKYTQAYKWLNENEIDLKDLSLYATSISAAVLLSFGGTSLNRNPPLPKPVQVEQIAVEELQGLNEDQKGKLVWERYGPAIVKVSRMHNIDPRLIFATIMIESGGNTYAIRSEPSIGDASYGLGQILYGTARGLGYTGTPENLYDPVTNIEIIGRYHRRNLEVYGNLSPQQLTTAYNTGNPYSYALPGHLDKFQRWFDKADRFIS